MGETQRQALAQLFAEDESFKATMMGATSVEDAVRIAGEHGIEATADDFALPKGGELSDAALDLAAGGTLGSTKSVDCWHTFVCVENC